MNDMKMTMNSVASFLDRADMRHQTFKDGQVIKTGFRGEIGNYPILISARNDPLVIFLVIRIPLQIPPVKRVVMAETIARINYGMVLGRFELDMRCGDLNFFAAIPLGDAEVTAAQFHTTLMTSLCLAERYHRAFGRLLFDNDLSPAEAVAEIEMAAVESKESQS